MLGFAPERPANLARALEKRGLLDGGGAGSAWSSRTARRPHDMFRARLMFPIRDAQGRVIAFGGRVLDAAAAEIYQLARIAALLEGAHVYGLYEARAGDRAAPIARSWSRDTST